MYHSTCHLHTAPLSAFPRTLWFLKCRFDFRLGTQEYLIQKFESWSCVYINIRQMFNLRSLGDQQIKRIISRIICVALEVSNFEGNHNYRNLHPWSFSEQREQLVPSIVLTKTASCLRPEQFWPMKIGIPMWL